MVSITSLSPCPDFNGLAPIQEPERMTFLRAKSMPSHFALL